MYHLDPRDLLPRRVSDSSQFKLIDGTARTAWAIVAMAMLLGGIALTWQTHRAFGLLCLGIVGGFVLVTLVTVGDPRYRYPVATFALALQGVSALWFYERVRAWRAAAD